MKTKRLFICALVACMLTAWDIPVALAKSGLVHDGILHVSIIDLIANSKKYDGKVVQLHGFARVTFEGNALYMSRDDANYLIQTDALWLGFKHGSEPSEYNGKWVRVQGTFNAKHFGHMGAFSGAIDDITRIELLNKYYDY